MRGNSLAIPGDDAGRVASCRILDQSRFLNRKPGGCHDRSGAADQRSRGLTHVRMLERIPGAVLARIGYDNHGDAHISRTETSVTGRCHRTEVNPSRSVEEEGYTSVRAMTPERSDCPTVGR